MKFENMHVKCETTKQREQVESILLKNGFKFVGVVIRGYKDVSVSAGKESFTHTCKSGYQKQYNFKEFMTKYIKQNEMIELINNAKSELKMNDSDLSLALGKSRQYIGKMLRLPQSKKVQDLVTKEINALLARDKFKELSIGNHAYISVENAEIKNGEIVVTGTIQDPKDKQISDLKKTNEQQKLVIDKLDDQLIKAEKIHNEDVKAIELKDKQIKEINDSRFNINLELVESKKLVDELTDALQWEQKEFDKTRDELKELKSSYTTSKALNWFFVVSIILAAIVWKAYNG